MTSWLDGFAKLHSFKMSGGNILFSGKMLEPPNYLASVEVGWGSSWSWWEKLQDVHHGVLRQQQPSPLEDRTQECGRMATTLHAVTDANVATRLGG